MTEERKTVAVDFDGVIHDWDGVWRGHHECPGEPIKDITSGLTSIEWLHQLLQHYDIIILTTRGRTWRGRWGVKRWFLKHTPYHLWDNLGPVRGLRRVRVTDRKPRALMYIDDRGFRFTGSTYPSANRIRAMRPYWKELLRE